MLRNRISRTIAATVVAGGIVLASATPALAASATVATTDARAKAAATTYRAGADGGTYAVVTVYDQRADGVCAHAALAWHHDNGNVYYDYGIYVCGEGRSFQKNTYSSRRNATQYREVRLQVWVDNGLRREVTLQRF